MKHAVTVAPGKIEAFIYSQGRGVFGMGGERVSEAETAALKEIALALDISIPNLSGV